MRKRGFAATHVLRTIGTAALAAVAAVVRAQDAAGVDPSTWKCEKCPFAEGKLTADIEAGAQYVDGADAKFGDFTGLDEDGGYAVLAGTAGELHDSGTYWAAFG